MQLDTTFHDMLHESYQELFESTMTSPQRRMVASLRSDGWRIVRDESSDSVKLTNGVDVSYVTPQGDITQQANESFSSVEDFHYYLDTVHLTESLSLINENEDLQPEMEVKKKALANNIALLLENLIIITLVRGRDVYVVTMSRHSNEYIKLTGDEVVESGNLHNRRTAQNLVDRLLASGFEEADWKSTIPRRVIKTARFAKQNVPTIGIIFLLWLAAPGVFTAIISFVIRLTGMFIGRILDTLPIPSLELVRESVEEALSLLNVNHEQIDGFSGAAPVNN